jgi:hypothetical protein
MKVFKVSKRDSLRLKCFWNNLEKPLTSVSLLVKFLGNWAQKLIQVQRRVQVDNRKIEKQPIAKWQFLTR